MGRVRLGGILFVVALTVSACGSSAATPGAAATTPAPAATKGAGTGAGTAGPATEAPEATTDVGAKPTFEMPAGGDGQCQVEIKGAISRSWTTKQNMGTLLVGQWLAPASRKMLSLGDGEASFLLNCGSDSGSISFMLGNDSTEAQFPMEPGDRVIAAGGALGGATPGKISALLSLEDDQLWHVTKDGTLAITSFGSSKFAGTFSFSIASDAGDATVTGSFNLSCTGDACK